MNMLRKSVAISAYSREYLCNIKIYLLAAIIAKKDNAIFRLVLHHSAGFQPSFVFEIRYGTYIFLTATSCQILSIHHFSLW